MQEVKYQHKLLRQENKRNAREKIDAGVNIKTSQPRFFELRPGEEFQGFQVKKKKSSTK